MRTQVFPGGWYGGAIPDGDYAVLYPDRHIEVRGGTVPLPGENVLGLVAHKWRGVLYFGGQGGGTGKGWFWDGTAWHAITPTTYGTFVMAFEADKVYVVESETSVKIFEITTRTFLSERPIRTGVNGIRQVLGGVILTGDATYHDPEKGINEFTQLVDLYVGQSQRNGIVWDAGVIRVLKEGDAWAIRALRSGDNIGVCLHDRPARTTHAFWLTAAEAKALPVEQALPDPPKPVDPPEPVEPKPMVKLTPSQFQSLDAARKALGKPTLTKQEGGAFINAWVYAHRNDANRPGLQGDETDPKAFMPDGTPIWTGLRLIVDGQHYGGDCFGAASVGRFDAVDAEFLPADATGPNGRIEAIPPSGSSIPPDSDPPDEDGSDSPIIQRITAIESTVRDIDRDVTSLVETVNALLKVTAELRVDLDNLKVTTAATAHKGDPITLHGTITFRLPSFLGGREYRLPVEVSGTL